MHREADLKRGEEWTLPELPEMENYKRLLNENITHEVINDVHINREKSINTTVEHFVSKVKGQKVIGITRRAKHLLFQLENGSVLLLHLMLGGWMFFGLEEERPKRTVQIRLTFGQKHLYFIGLRLGYLHLYSLKEANIKLLKLGPEPLDPSFTLDVFINALNRRKGRLKSKLIDQNFVSGIGNCYSNEICFHSRVNPNRNIAELTESEQTNLYQSIQSVLREAVNLGGYLENPFFKGDTYTGGYKDLCQVYDREGKGCNRCGTPIFRDEISSRKTFFCPNCQK